MPINRSARNCKFKELGRERLMRRPILNYAHFGFRLCLLPFSAETFLAVRFVKGGERTCGFRAIRCAEGPPTRRYPEMGILWVTYTNCVVPPVTADYVRKAPRQNRLDYWSVQPGKMCRGDLGGCKGYRHLGPPRTELGELGLQLADALCKLGLTTPVGYCTSARHRRRCHRGARCAQR